MKTIAQKAYQKNEESSDKGALKRLIETYDHGIQAGIRKDKAKAEHVLSLLVSSLRPEPNPELALSLQAIYQDCRGYLEDANFAEFTESMERLKGLWIAYGRLRGKD